MTGDAYAGGKEHGFVQSGFLSHGIRYTVSEFDRSALYLEMVSLVNSNTVQLVNNPDMFNLDSSRGAS